MLLLPERHWKADWVRSPVLHGLIVSRRKQVNGEGGKSQGRREEGHKLGMRNKVSQKQQHLR